MKTMFRTMIRVAMAVVLGSNLAVAQKIDEERMKRDIEVAENVLSTLIKQQFSNQRTFFPLEIKANYQPGYGVTFSLPADFTTPIVFTTIGNDNNNVVVYGGSQSTGDQYTYTWSGNGDAETIDVRGAEPTRAGSRTTRLKETQKEKTRVSMDSIRDVYNLKVIDAAKTFLVDYGDMITQLGAQERIVISNQGNQPKMWVNQYFNAPKRTHLSVEGLKSDLTQYKQGKISRDQALSKIKVVNTETVEAVEPDLELLSSIFNRLYRSDLSKTYFTEDNIYYERLKDFGVIFYMQVYSSNERDYRRFSMPTLDLDDVDLETRNKKVKEIYPKFEQDLKENILEYGRTLKSLKDEEILVFQVKVTKCPECGIPSSLEYNIKGSVLRDYSSGKIDKNGALTKFTVKKGPNQ
jgi:hypothetical protein